MPSRRGHVGSAIARGPVMPQYAEPPKYQLLCKGYREIERQSRFALDSFRPAAAVEPAPPKPGSNGQGTAGDYPLFRGNGHRQGDATNTRPDGSPFDNDEATEGFLFIIAVDHYPQVIEIESVIDPPWFLLEQFNVEL